MKARKAILPDIGKLSGARTGLLPVFLEPSLASLCEKPPTGPKWIHEIKYDGYRMQARIDGRTIRLLTRKKLDWTERFRSIADALKALGLGSALIVDGVLEPMELAHLPYKKGRTYEDYVGLRGLQRLGKKKWRQHVFDVVKRLKAALEADYVVLGGGNAKVLKKLPPGARLGNNAYAFRGGYRLWRDPGERHKRI